MNTLPRILPAISILQRLRCCLPSLLALGRVTSCDLRALEDFHLIPFREEDDEDVAENKQNETFGPGTKNSTPS